MVYQALEALRVVVLFFEEIEQDAGVEVAATRAHHEPSRRRESHRGVERPSVAYRRHARAIAQVGDDDARGRRAGKRLHNVFERDTVKAEAADSLVPQCARQREALGHFRHLSMESGVEARHLRQARKPASSGLDAIDFARKMERREWDQTPQRLCHRGSDPFRCNMMGASVYETMARGLGPRQVQAINFVKQRKQWIGGSGEVALVVAQHPLTSVAEP